MLATRTQVHLTGDQRARTDQLTSSQVITVAEVVRRALDSSLGAAPDATAPGRDEWDRG